MLSNLSFEKHFQAEVINVVAYFLVNRSPSTTIKCKIPFQTWFGSLIDYSQLSVFGCPAYTHGKDAKLEPIVKNAYFQGMRLE